MSYRHIPRVRITTPSPTHDRPFPPAVMTRVEVNGADWPVVGYAVADRLNDRQLVTLTFYADLTIEHPEATS